MPLDFPNSPTNGQVFNGDGVSWKWDGVKWTSVLASGGPYLPLSGGTVTGPVTIGHDQPTYWTFNGQNGFAQCEINGTAQFLSSGSYSFADAAGNGLLQVNPTGSGVNTNMLQIFTAPAGSHVIMRSGDTIEMQPGAGGLGGVWINANQTLSGAQWREIFSIGSQLSGSTSYQSPTGVCHLSFYDTVDASASAIKLINYFELDAQFGGTAQGYRQGLTVNLQLNQGALTTRGANYVGIVGSASASVSAGGTALTRDGAGGGIFGANFYASVGGTAQNMGGVVGIEVNPAIGVGSTACNLVGIQVVPTSTHLVRGAGHWDLGYSMCEQVGAVPIDIAYAVGSGGAQWPIRSDGSLFRGCVSNQGSGAVARHGIFLNEVSFPAFGAGPRGGAFVSNAFAVDGVGAIQSGPTYITPTPAGTIIDVKGSVGTGTPTVAAGGSGYTDGDTIYDDYGGVYTAHVTGGVVTSVTVWAGANGEAHQPWCPSHTPPANPVVTKVWAYSPGAAGCTLNLSWDTSRTQLVVQQSGGPTTFGGAVATTGTNPITVGNGPNVGISIQPAPGAGNYALISSSNGNLAIDAPALLFGWAQNPTIRFYTPNAWTANGTKAVSLTALAPAAASATVVEWLTIQDATGTTRYIPCF
jgi:hypothetical protein